MEFIIWFVVWALIGLAIGAAKGRLGECILACVILGPIGFLLCCCLTHQRELDKKKERKNSKRCPHCAEYVAKEAKICKHCRSSVETISCPGCKTRLFKPDGVTPGAKLPCPKCFTEIRIS